MKNGTISTIRDSIELRVIRSCLESKISSDNNIKFILLSEKLAEKIKSLYNYKDEIKKDYLLYNYVECHLIDDIISIHHYKYRLFFTANGQLKNKISIKQHVMMCNLEAVLNVKKEQEVIMTKTHEQQLAILRQCLPEISATNNKTEKKLFDFFPGEEAEKLFSLSERTYHGAYDFVECTDKMTFVLTNKHVIVTHFIEEKWYNVENGEIFLHHEISDDVKKVFYPLEEIFI